MPPLQLDTVTALARRVNTGPLTVAELQAICKAHDIRPRTGRKDQLKERIVRHIHNVARVAGSQELNRLRLSLYDPYNKQAGHQPQGVASNLNQSRAPATLVRPTNGIGTLHFKESPFYQLQEDLCRPTLLPALEASKGSVLVSLTLSQAQNTQLQQDPSIKVLMYGAVDQGALTRTVRNEITFPNAIEIKIHGSGEIKGSALKGVKNKPGSIKPADLTPHLPKFGDKSASIQVFYGQTLIPFYVILKLVRFRPVEELVNLLRHGKVITVDSVYKEMMSKTEDAELEATSTVMSLKCPLSYMRMSLPCRSTICSHNQCFDATSFLESQTQIPLWSCPVCSRRIEFSSLAVDQYVEDILQNTSVKVENVTIEPGGSWVETVRSTQKNTRGESKHSQDDGAAATAGTSLKRRRSTDVLAAEVIDLEVDPPKKKIVVLNLHAKPVTATPKSPKSTAITAQSAVGSPSRKSTPLFVDLTNSSDDEDTGEEFGIDLRNGKRASTEDTAAKNAFHTPVSLDSSEHGFHGEDRADTMWHGPTSMLPTGASLPFRQDDFYP